MSDLKIFDSGETDPAGTIATPMRDSIATETHVSFMRTDYRWTSGRPIGHLYIQGSQLPLQRNEAIHRMRGDWIIFVDDDMVFEPDAIGRLVGSYERLKEHYTEPLIVGALCVRRYPPFQPTVMKAVDMTEGPFMFIEDWEGQDFVEVDATGAAFYLIEPAVFTAIMGGPFPPAEERAQLKPWPYYEWYGEMGEDLRFCLKAKAAGCRIFVDATISVGHAGRQIFTERDFYRAVSERAPEVEEVRRAANDLRGLPTLTAEEGRERYLRS